MTITVADPDLQFRGGGGGGGGLQKHFLGPFGSHLGLKIRGGGGPLPWVRHCIRRLKKLKHLELQLIKTFTTSKEELNKA